MASGTILVVDDDQEACKALAESISSTGRDSLPPQSNICELRLDNIVGSSPEMRLVFQQVAQIAPSRATVLLTGESGTGKELVVAAIHGRSERASGPLVSVHCAALSDGLLESELFGHERGSFTGAEKQRRGCFEQADGGTLFLDEIAEISPATQVKLLRVLQEREFERVGGNETIHVEVRIVTATNRDLKEMIAKGTFREDLYYRLNVINVHLPPLRERASDIPALAEHFLRIFVADNETAARRFSDDAVKCLVHYRWPGNVRELENVVQRAVVLAEGELIEPQHLALEVAMDSRCDTIPSIPGATMLDFERYAIQKAIVVTGSARNAAKALGISVRKIQYRLQEYRMASGGDAHRDLELPTVRPRRIGFRP
jgi:two-component system response regulator HydG